MLKLRVALFFFFLVSHFVSLMFMLQHGDGTFNFEGT